MAGHGGPLGVSSADAPPFVPAAGGSAAPSFSPAALAAAAPFVPARPLAGGAPSVSAQPFVPGGARQAALELDAPAFVPTSRAGTANVDAAPFVPAAAQTQQAHAAPMPHRHTAEPAVPAGPPLGDVAQFAAMAPGPVHRSARSALGFGGPAPAHQPHQPHHHHHHHHQGNEPPPPRPVPLSERFVDEPVRQEVHFKQLLAAGYVPPRPGHPPPDAEAPGVVPLPEFLGNYHSLGRLDADPASHAVHAAAAAGGATAASATSAAFPGFATECLRAVSTADGRAACVRVIAHPEPAVALPAVDRAARRWEKLKNHPCMCPVLSAFSAHEYGGQALLCVVTAYHPLSVTLHESLTGPGPVGRRKLPEPAAWRFACQLLSLMAEAHAMGLYFGPGDVHATKLLVDNNRIRLGGVGLGFALGLDAAPQEVQRSPGGLPARQKADLARLAGVLAAAASGGLAADPIEACLAEMAGPGSGGGASADFIAMLRALAAPAASGGVSTAGEALSRASGQLARELLATESRYDRAMSSLSAELDNGRMCRVLVKLCTCVDHPGLPGGGGRWGETGDRYVLRLFFDFVFHPTEPTSGAPQLDWGHVFECCNKLDAGVEEQVTLVSRDGATLLVASYAELKRCLLVSYAELQAGAQKAHARAKNG